MKKLHKAALIGFNIIAVLFGIYLVLSMVALDREAFITDHFFGGYKTDIVSAPDEDTTYYKSIYNSVAQVKAGNNNIAIAAMSEGATLLKNDGALPLSKGAKVSLFSVTSTDPVYHIGGSGKVSIAEAEKISFKQVFEEDGLEVNPALYTWYNQHREYHRVEAKSNGGLATIGEASWDEIATSAKTDAEYGDAAIFVLGRWGNESVDLQWTNGGKDGDFTEGDYLRLNPKEISVLTALKAEKEKGTFKKVILIINSASPIRADFLKHDDYGIDAALWMGVPGTAGLYAIADIMTGRVTPSGRLSDTWYMGVEHNPVMANYGNFKHQFPYVVYQEGIYLGYRYTETRYEDYVTGRAKTGAYDYDEVSAYPFGYGLSYTTFSYSDFRVEYDNKNDVYEVHVTVTNTGDFAGKEVVQIYLQQPYTRYDIDHNIEKAAAELVGFYKTAKLKAGEHEEAVIRVDGKYFASFDTYGAGTYYLDAGDYYLTAARNAHDAVNQILAAKGHTPENTDGRMDAEGDAKLVHKVQLSADAEKYSTACNTGAKIKVLFDDADLNRLNDGVNTVQYMTRNNWEGTVGKTQSVTLTDKIRAGHNIDADKGVRPDDSPYPVYGKDSGIKLISLRLDEFGEKRPYDDPLWDTFLDQLTWEQTCTLLGNGYRKTVELTELGKPGTVDHNGSNGYLEQFGANGAGLACDTNDPDAGAFPTGYPCEGIIASTFNTKLAETVGNAIGEDSLWSGQPGLYGFGLNLHRSPYHGRYAEYYSEDSFLAGTIAGYESRGVAAKGGYVYNKHFALNEQETNRTSYETWLNEQTLRQIYLRAYEISIDIGNSMNVMTAFNRIGSVWTGNSHALCTDYLRGEAGMAGFAVTDWRMVSYMGMAGGVLAGNDLPDGEYDEFDKFRTGYGNVANAMRESAHRIFYTVVHSNAMNGIGTGTRFIVHDPVWVKPVKDVRIALSVLFGVSTACLIATSVLSVLKLRKKK